MWTAGTCWGTLHSGCAGVVSGVNQVNDCAVDVVVNPGKQDTHQGRCPGPRLVYVEGQALVSKNTCVEAKLAVVVESRAGQEAFCSTQTAKVSSEAPSECGPTYSA